MEPGIACRIEDDAGEREHHHDKVDECAQCGGIRLDKGELENDRRFRPARIRIYGLSFRLPSMMPETGKTQRGSRSAVSASVPGGKKRSSTSAALVEIADTLYRTAAASCSEHRRYADLVERSVSDAEQKAARSAVRACDEALDEATDLYEVACLKESNHADDAWWHRANMVWRAAKEFIRHHASSDKMTRGGPGHGRAELLELTIEYKLEASAILRLRHTIDAYRESRPEAGLV